MDGSLSNSDKNKLSKIIISISQKNDIEEQYIEFEKALINDIRVNNPELLDKLPKSSDYTLYDTLNYIVEKYNSFIDSRKNIESEFKRIELIATSKNIKYASIYNQIGKQLTNGIPPTVLQINYASYFFNKNNTQNNVKDKSKKKQTKITELVLRRMVEWDSLAKILSEKERMYIADYAYGLKKITSFHEKNLMTYYERLKAAGYEE